MKGREKRRRRRWVGLKKRAKALVKVRVKRLGNAKLTKIIYNNNMWLLTV